MKLSMGEVAARLGASAGTPDRLIEGYSIDSRTLTPGSLFFALRGPRFDGHEFVGQALDRGASGAVVERAFREKVSPEMAARLIGVSDTVTALQVLAQSVRRSWGRAVVGVTGSTGKTTTKELIAALLATKYSVHKSSGNLNNQYGVPLTLLALEPDHEVAVVEMAMSGPGEIGRLAEIAEPETGVVTNVAPVHLEFFDSVDAIARAKRELIEHLKSPATAVLNRDDPRVRRFRDGFDGRVVTFGLGEGADFRALDLAIEPSHGEDDMGMRFRVASPAWDAEFQMALPGRHNVENALAAIATASVFEVPVESMVEALGNFKPIGQRSEVLRLPGPVVIINDCYNSNPRALEQMLETLAGWPRATRRILVAGEMLELGPTSPELHRQTGRKGAQVGIDWLIAVQGNARFILEGAIQAGLPAVRTRFFPDAERAGKFCRGLIEPGDVVLVKGSRGVHLERVVETLQALPVRSLS